MKKYYFLWIDDRFGLTRTQVDFISAKDKLEATKAAVLLLRFYTDNKTNYNTKNLKVYEIEDYFFKDIEMIKEKIELYSKSGIYPYLPPLDELMKGLFDDEENS